MKLAEGFGPIYYKGKQIPRYRLDKYPEEEKNIILKVMKERIESMKKKPKVQPKIKNIKNLA